MTWIDWIFAVLGVASLCAFARLVAGPSLADRIVALDLIASISVAVIILYDIASDQPVFLDAATVVALISFLGTVALSRYMERKGTDE
jgi:multicomponent Na+:H+ antiporter subunit F